MKRLTGRGAAPGLARGPAALVQPAPRPTDDAAGSPEKERARLDDALSQAAAQLRELAAEVTGTVGQNEGAIFSAHASFAEDPELASRARSSVAAGRPASVAVTEAFDGFRELLQASDSDYLAARTTDLDDVRDRVLTLLAGGTPDIEAPDQPSVIVAHELTPSQTASIPREVITALVTETGSPTSHAAILARSLGVPAVVGLTGIVELVSDGVAILVDGRGGEVVIEPDAAALERFDRRMDTEARKQAKYQALRGEPTRTIDGHRIELAANIGSDDDLRLAVEAGAEGSGLVRTEFLYLDRVEAPDVAEQAGFVEKALRAFPGHRVIVRTLDVGADKPVPFVARAEEANPALGLRGIRLSLAQPTLFREQLEALLVARENVAGDGGRLAVMFPMVSTPAEFVTARRHLTEVAEERDHDLEGLEIGVMIETPAAALTAARFAGLGDFLSIGTNDLLQYVFAADRLNADVTGIADAADPLVLKLIGQVVEAAHEEGAWVGVCGEAASEPAIAAALVGLAVDELSMSGAAIPEIRATLRGLTYGACQEAVAGAQALTNATAVRESFESIIEVDPETA